MDGNEGRGIMGKRDSEPEWYETQAGKNAALGLTNFW